MSNFFHAAQPRTEFTDFLKENNFAILIDTEHS